MRFLRRIVALSLVLPAGLFAADINYSAGLTLAHHTNVNHVSDPLESEFEQSVHGIVSLVENTADLEANIDAGVEFTAYRNDTATEQNSAELIGNGLWHLRPGQLEWSISDTYTKTAIDIFGSDILENRQNANAFYMGPNYFVHISNRNSIEIQARVEDYYFSEAEADNERISGAAIWEYALNSATDLAFEYESESVNYNNDSLNTDFLRNDVFIGFQYHRDVNTLEAHVGVAKITPDNSAEINENRYFIAIQNQRTHTSNVRVQHERRLTDTSSELQDIVRESDQSTQLLVTSSELYVSTTTNIAYEKMLSIGSILTTLERSDSDYLITNALDQSGNSLMCNILWDLGGRSSIIFDASYSQNEFVSLVPVRIDDDSVYAIAYRRNAGRNLNFSIRAEATERKSTELNSSYDSFVTTVTLEYTSF